MKMSKKRWKRLWAALLTSVMLAGNLGQNAVVQAAPESETAQEKEDAETTKTVEYSAEAVMENAVMDADSLPDNDELFAGYVQQQMYAGQNEGG